MTLTVVEPLVDYKLSFKYTNDCNSVHYRDAKSESVVLLQSNNNFNIRENNVTDASIG